jgi:tetratricopeptide (TPR) repeat protein
MIRLTLLAAVLGMLAAAPVAYLFTATARQEPSGGQGSREATAAASATQAKPASIESASIESWPICSSMTSMVETADWASLDPDFAAGKRAIVAGDWKGAVAALTSAGLRDARNANIQNYLGYAYRRLRQLDDAVQHYQQAVALNPRHRGAHEHLGEASLVRGDLSGAEEHLAALERICLIQCDEYHDLEQAIAEYRKIARR